MNDFSAPDSPTDGHDGNQSKQTPSQSRTLAAGIALVVVLLGGVGIYLIFGSSAPDEVDLEATRDATNTGSDDRTDVVNIDANGTWTINNEIGEFVVDGNSTSSFVGFRVDEELASIGATTAVGRTPAVSGSIQIDGLTVTSVEIEADLTQIRSDIDKREAPIQRALNTQTNPTATFTLSEPFELPGVALAGEIVTANASGVMTVNGIGVDMVIPIEAQLSDGSVLVTGSIVVALSQFDVAAPSAASVISVSDNATIEMQLWLSR